MIEWNLLGQTEEHGPDSRTSLRPLPFVVGRAPSAQLRLWSTRVSSQHATFFERDGALFLQDLGSTNGTFVNGQRLAEERGLADGDIVHFADVEFRIAAMFIPGSDPTGDDLATSRIERTQVGIILEGIRRTRDLVALLESGSVSVDFQPVVDLASGAVVAFEALGRVRHPGLPVGASELFALAQRLNLVRRLSEAFRKRALLEAPRLPASAPARPKLFVNTLPAEVRDCGELLDDLSVFRRSCPDMPLVLEIHESAVTDVGELGDLRRRLQSIDVGLAFDDFGKGAARLRELCEAEPDYVKFDRTFVSDVSAGAKRGEMTRALVKMIADLGIVTLLEGVETEDEARSCREAGFDLGQGYFFGRPSPVEDLRKD